MNPLFRLCLLVPAVLLGNSALAYTTVENRSLDAGNIRDLVIRTYSGPLTISRSDNDRIEVEVLIEFNNDWDDDEARQALSEGLVLDLERRGSRAELDSWVGDYDENDDVSFFTWGLIDFFRSGKDRPYSHLEVKVPEGIDLRINDYRGEVIISGTRGDLELRTGGGDAFISNIDGDLDLQDGGGEIAVSEVTGDVEIRDGGGSLEVGKVGARLTIHDGGGSIEVANVGGHLDIRNGGGSIRVRDIDSDGEIYDGSGEITVSRVKGSISFTDGGGGINVSDVGKDVIVYRRGGGSFNVRNVQGEVIEAASAPRDTRGNYRNRYWNWDRDTDIDEDIDIDADIDVD